MKNWQIFFLALLLCALAAAAIPWIYQRSQFLTAPQVQINRELWENSKPASYTLHILKTDGTSKTAVLLRVAPGQERVCRENGSFLGQDQAAKWMPEALFDQLSQWLAEAATDPGQHYLTARFHPQYGLPIRSVFRAKIQGKRVEIQVAIQTE